MERPDTGEVRLGGHDAWDSVPRGSARRPGYVMPVFQDPVGGLDRRWPLWRILAEPARGRGDRLTRQQARPGPPSCSTGSGWPASTSTAGRAASRSARPSGSGSPARSPPTPALLVADEPTASLDVIAATAITALLREIADAGTAVLVVSHDRPRLRAYTDRIVTMHDGRLEEAES